MRRLLLLLLLATPLLAQAPARQRLILKDGTYQTVKSYKVDGAVVHFRSAERGDDEDLPADLIDWPATARWNREHDPDATPDPASPAAQEAAALDKAAADAKAAEAARQPTVAPGLRLPDESGVWALDSFKDTPELVRIRQSDGDLNTDLGHTVKAAPVPEGGARDLIRLDGYRARVAFHVPRPVFYIALDTTAPAREDALVVDTHGASAQNVNKNERASPSSSYALVRLRVNKNLRAAAGQAQRALAPGGGKDGSAVVVATERAILPGGRWMRVTPRDDLNLGQYALVELLGAGQWNQDGWDFGVNPLAPENKPVFTPAEE